jgi:molecular chaperone GrpE
MFLVKNIKIYGERCRIFMANDTGYEESRNEEEGYGVSVPPELGPEAEQTAQDLGSPQERISPEETIADLQEQIAALNDQYLRKAADFENFRKRMIRDKQETADFANQGILLDLIPVIDDFERAIKSAETSKDFSSFYEGVTMIEKRLSSQLENKWGLKPYHSVGEVFDPNRHEAIATEKSPDTEEPKVGEEFLKGYTLKDRVIRTAKVKVLMPDQPQESQ